MKLNILTNTRPTSDLGNTLIVGCTEGNIKLSPDAGKTLEVAPGDRVAVARDPETGKVYAFKGAEGVGNKLAKSGSYFSMSSANVWAELGGDANLNKTFTVATEATEGEDGDSNSYFEVTFASETPKSGRKGSVSVDEVAPAQENGSVEEVEEVEEI